LRQGFSSGSPENGRPYGPFVFYDRYLSGLAFRGFSSFARRAAFMTSPSKQLAGQQLVPFV
ncbi:hypothetical protein, partial [Klebsiella pneumoniae]|uniref:hypothetical protein n=1 Tax=Klebsiella pneumoniae TaxID=573 RepID=UPI0027310CE8